MKYSNNIKINPVFQNSINLQFDINSEKKIKEYIPTKEACSIIKLYIDSILPNGNKSYRSTLFYGPYGKGKSFLILILIFLISTDCTSKTYVSLLKNIKEIDKELYGKIVELNDKKIRLLPVLINSDYDDINQAFIIGLTDAQKREKLGEITPKSNFDVAIEIINAWLEDKNVNDTIISLCQEKMKISLIEIKSKLMEMSIDGYNLFCSFYECVSGGLPFNPLIKRNIASNLETVAEKISSKFSGLFIVFDEFGKFLESGVQGLSQQLKLLQDVFELALRSSDNKQIHLCCINHKKISAYAKNALIEHVLSFRAIEGRVKEIGFTRTISENYSIIAKAIHKNKDYLKYLHNVLDIENSEYYKWFVSKGFVNSSSSDILFFGCFPLNPIAAYSLIQLSEIVAQNERTLFTFISDNDQNSLNSFLNKNDKGEFCVDRLYDYFSPSFEKEEERIRNIWIKTESILDELIDFKEIALLKAIAISMILKDNRMFPCNEDYLQHALSFDIHPILQNLSDKNFINKEIITNQYCISSYSSKEIKLAIQKYHSKHRNIDITEELSNISPVSFVPARKYNAENKMTRYFHTIYIEDTTFMNYAMLHNKSSVLCDGVIYQILNTGTIPFDQIKIHFNEIEKEDCVIVGYSSHNINDAINALIRDYCALCHLCNNQKNSPNITNEMNILKEQVKLGLDNELKKIFSSSVWLNDINKSLSEIMYSELSSKFKSSLLINNELLNKHVLTTQYKKARDTIVNRILNSNLDNSDLSPTSPEMTVFNSVFDEKNNHVDFAVYDIINLILKTAGEKKEFENIVNLLIQKPYGAREGVIPLLIAKAISMLSGNFLLYIFNKEIEVNARNIGNSVDNTENVYFYYEKDDANKTKYLNNLAKEFEVSTNKQFIKNLYHIVDAMQKYFSSLPSIIRSGKADELLDIDSQSRKLVSSFMKYDLNRFELVFNTIPDIYACKHSDEFDGVIKKIHTSKCTIEKCVDVAITKICHRILVLFNANDKESLKSAIIGWIVGSNVKLKNLDCFNSIEKKTYNFLVADSLPFDNSEIVNMLSRIIIGSIISDWQNDYSDEIIDTLSNIIKKIDKAEENKTPIEKPILKPLSALGTVLKRNLIGTINDYGESISDEEKRNVLRAVMEEMGL